MPPIQQPPFEEALDNLILEYEHELARAPLDFVEALGAHQPIALAALIRAWQYAPDRIDALLDRCCQNLRANTWDCLLAAGYAQKDAGRSRPTPRPRGTGAHTESEERMDTPRIQAPLRDTLTALFGRVAHPMTGAQLVETLDTLLEHYCQGAPDPVALLPAMAAASALAIATAVRAIRMLPDEIEGVLDAFCAELRAITHESVRQMDSGAWSPPDRP